MPDLSPVQTHTDSQIIGSARWVALWILLSAFFVPTPSLALSNQADELSRIQARTGDLLRQHAQVESSVEQRAAQTLAIEQKLLTDSAVLIGPDITATSLRQAHLALLEIQSRMGTLQDQISRHDSDLNRLRTQFETLEQAIAAAPGDQLSDLTREVRRRLLGVQADATRELITAMDHLATAEQDQGAVAQAYLDLLHERTRPAVTDWAAGLEQDPRLALIEQVRGELQRGSLEAGPRPQQDPYAQDLATRAQLRRLDLDLLDIGYRLESIGALLEDPTMPAPALDQGAAILAALELDLIRHRETLKTARSAIASRRALLRVGDAYDKSSRWAITNDLSALIQLQEDDLSRLIERLAHQRDRLRESAKGAHRIALTSPGALPTSASGWYRSALSIQSLPGRIAREWSHLGTQVSERIQSMNGIHWALSIGGLLLVAGGLSWSGRRLGLALKRSAPRGGRTLAWVPLSAIPAAIWTLAGGELGVPTDRLVPILLLLGLWPAVTLALGLARLGMVKARTLDTSSPAFETFYRSLRRALVGAAILATIGLLAQALPLGPVAADLLQRLSMIGPVLLAIPAFGLRQWVKQDRTLSWTRRAIAVALSRVLPIALLGIGLLGITGYGHLALTLIHGLWWLAIAGAGLYFVARVMPMPWHTDPV